MAFLGGKTILIKNRSQHDIKEGDIVKFFRLHGCDYIKEWLRFPLGLANAVSGKMFCKTGFVQVDKK